MAKRFKTDYPGVYYILGQRSDAPGEEKIFYVAFRDGNGKLREEKAGRQFKDRMTPRKASDFRSERITGKRKSRREERREFIKNRASDTTRPTISRLWELYHPTLKKSLRTDKSNFNHLSDIHQKTPDEIQKSDITKIQREMSKDGKAPQTIKHVMVLLIRIINFGLELQEEENNKPVPAILGCVPLGFKIKHEKFNNEVTEFLSERQRNSLLDAIERDLEEDPWTGRAMLLALCTGMRRGELLRLQWRDIDFERGFIKLRETKSGKVHEIPINKAGKEIIEAIPRTRSRFVFPGNSGRQRSDFNRGSRRIAKAAELPEDFRPFHGLRHHFASALASSGKVTLYTIQNLLTHSDPKMTQRYAKLMDDALKSASSLAGDFVKPKKEEEKENKK